MNQKVGRYRVLEQLGQGAMAVVYKVYDASMERQLAMKMLREDKSIDGEMLRRFLREAQAVGKLSHPNIVKVYDVGQINERPFIIMELLEGKFLDELIKENTHFAIDEVLDFAKQLGAALQCAHNHGIIHRDLKPANVIWFKDENLVKLTDFGVAHLDTQESAVTQVGDIIGTPQYMSPEQYAGKLVDNRSDLFSLGVVLYQLVTGKRPFNGDSVAALAYQVTHANPEPVRKLNSSAPQYLADAIERLLAKRPEERFQDADAFIEAINPKPSASPIPIPIPPIKDIPKPVKWGSVAAGVLLLLLIITLLIPSGDDSQGPKITDTGTKSNMVTDKDKQALEERLSSLECSNIKVKTKDNKVILTGHISKKADSQFVNEVVFASNLNNVSMEIKTLHWPFCQLATILSHFDEHKQVSVSPVVKRLNKNGQELTVKLTTPSFNSYLYIDLFRPNGEVIHLHQGKAESPKETTFSMKQKLLAINLDKSMVSVIATTEPIPGTGNGNQEQAGGYLTHLHRELVVNKKKAAADYKQVSFNQ